MVDTSDGPDRFRGHIKCKDFHTQDPPARSGHPDYCCCCNPCLYDRPGDKSLQTQFQHCCRCFPRILFLEFAGEYGESCAKDFTIPIFAEQTETIGDELKQNRYVADFFGTEVVLTIGDAGSGGYTCEWRLEIYEWGIDESIAIDHVDVTCLEPPVFTIENATGPGAVNGEITFSTYDMVKVPFQLREQPEVLYHEVSCGDCTQVCHTLCVSGRRYDGGEAERVEFVWVEGAGVPTWTYSRPDGGREETITLEENAYGECELHTDFDEYPKNLDPIELTNCSCELDVENTFQHNESLTGLVAFRIRCGSCTCWEHLCGTCRCVPKTICAFGFEGTEFFGPLNLEWDGTSWTGTDTDGSVYSVGPSKDENGDCVLSGGDFGSVSFECGEFISFEISSTDEYGTFRYMAGGSLRSCEPSFCADATPCATECQSHPETLTATLRGWNDPYLDEPGVEGECLVEVTMHYVETFTFTGMVPPERTCKYLGFSVFECNGNTEIIRYELKNGTFSVLRGAQEFSYELYYEACNPYEGEFPETATELTDCAWGGCNISIQRERITIVE